MSENIPQLEPDRQLVNFSREYELENQLEFQMIQRGDFVKPGWWHWRCRREGGRGDVAYGYVRADALGRAVMPETFEKDRL